MYGSDAALASSRRDGSQGRRRPWRRGERSKPSAERSERHVAAGGSNIDGSARRACSAGSRDTAPHETTVSDSDSDGLAFEDMLGDLEAEPVIETMIASEGDRGSTFGRDSFFGLLTTDLATGMLSVPQVRAEIGVTVLVRGCLVFPNMTQRAWEGACPEMLQLCQRAIAMEARVGVSAVEIGDVEIRTTKVATTAPRATLPFVVRFGLGAMQRGQDAALRLAAHVDHLLAFLRDGLNAHKPDCELARNHFIVFASSGAPERHPEDGPHDLRLGGGQRRADGSMQWVKFRGTDKERRIVRRPDGAVESVLVASGRKRTWHPNGQREDLYSNGTVVNRWPNGSQDVQSPDGSVLHFDAVSGQRSFTFHDGSSVVVTADGRRTQTLPDGTTITTTCGGRVMQCSPDGSSITQFSDGRKLEQRTDGTTIESRQDGSKMVSHM